MSFDQFVDALKDYTLILTGDSWRPLDWRHLIDGDAEDENPTILRRTDGAALLYRGRVHSIYAEPEGLKSWLALEACRQELEAGETVVYIDFEDHPRGVLARLRALGVADDVIDKRFVYVRPSERLGADAWAHIEGVLADQPSLVVCDGVTEAMVLEGLSLLDNSDVATFFEHLPRRIVRAGPAVLLLDHVGRNKEARGRFAIGAQAKLAGIDGAAFAIEIQEPFGRNRTGRARLQLRKDRIGHVSEHAAGSKRDVASVTATSDGDNVKIRLEPPAHPDSWKPTHLMGVVSGVVELTPGLSQKQITDQVPGRREYVLQALRNLIEEGYVRVEAGPRNSSIHYSERPYVDPKP